MVFRIPMRILLASKNSEKFREFQKLLCGVDVMPWPVSAPDIPEDGAFFQENAAQKAEFAQKWFLRNEVSSIDGVLADDSGLCIDALWGGPGVLTARFANGLKQHTKNELILSKMPTDKPRSARFVCVIAWLPNIGKPGIFSGTIEGTMAIEPRGAQGFGYDPIFIPHGFRNTLGELSNDVKNQISHRSKAVKAFLTGISDYGVN